MNLTYVPTHASTVRAPKHQNLHPPCPCASRLGSGAKPCMAAKAGSCWKRYAAAACCCWSNTSCWRWRSAFSSSSAFTWASNSCLRSSFDILGPRGIWLRLQQSKAVSTLGWWGTVWIIHDADYNAMMQRLIDKGHVSCYKLKLFLCPGLYKSF